MPLLEYGYGSDCGVVCAQVAVAKVNTARTPHVVAGAAPSYVQENAAGAYASTMSCASPNRQFQNVKKARVWDRAF